MKAFPQNPKEELSLPWRIHSRDRAEGERELKKKKGRNKQEDEILIFNSIGKKALEIDAEREQRQYLQRKGRLYNNSNPRRIYT